MNKNIKYIFVGIAAIIISYIVFVVALFIFCSHTSTIGDFETYSWVFKDSIKKDIDRFRVVGYSKENDVLYGYVYKNEYTVTIWELKELGIVDLNSVRINFNKSILSEKLSFSETLYNDLNPEIDTRLGLSFKDGLNLNVSQSATIVEEFSSTNYKGFCCLTNRMVLADGKGKAQVIIRFVKGENPTLVLLSKMRGSFYFIMINSKKDFDASIINILNLS